MAGAISAGAANHSAGGKQVGNDRNRGKGDAAGGGGATQALTKGLQAAQSQSFAKAPGNAQAADKAFKGAGGRIVNGRAERGDQPAGAKSNKPAYVTPMDQPAPPGATPYDEGATPYGAASTVIGGIGNAIRRALTQGFTGTDPDADEMGTQTGWSADRTKGGTFNSNDPRGADAGLFDDEREIAGRPYRADSTDETDDPSSETPSGDIYSDVMLKDRRKPVPTLKQMLESML
jgi:hypothetical protein